jgi:hypothetical protein
MLACVYEQAYLSVVYVFTRAVSLQQRNSSPSPVSSADLDTVAAD